MWACDSEAPARAPADRGVAAAPPLNGETARSPLFSASNKGDAGHGRDLASSGSPSPERIAQVMAMSPEGDALVTLTQLARESADPAIREAAVVALANSEDGRAIDALIAAATDPEPRVALAAIELLSWSEDRQARAALEALTGSEDAAIAQAAARIVAK